MFAFRDVREGVGLPAVHVAFTDRHAPSGELDVGYAGTTGEVAAQGVLGLLAREFAPEAPDALPIGMSQVHGADVHVVDDPVDRDEIVADALVTARPGVTLLVRVADCVPVLLASDDHTMVAAIHAGRPGLAAGVVPAAVAVMREAGAADIHAWLGPHVCGACYEVPEQLRAEVSAVVPEAFAETSWGTPSLDIGAGVRAQLSAAGATVQTVDRCTREDDDLWSYRRDGKSAGRLGGLIRIVP